LRIAQAAKVEQLKQLIEEAEARAKEKAEAAQEAS
jgi:hypothetical protein